MYYSKEWDSIAQHPIRYPTSPNITKAMKITATAAIAALALPSAVVGQRCYNRNKDRACRNPEDIFKIVRDIDKDEW